MTGPEPDRRDGRAGCCARCGFRYDPRRGDPAAGVPPGVPAERLPPGWRCPACGAERTWLRAERAGDGKADGPARS